MTEQPAIFIPGCPFSIAELSAMAGDGVLLRVYRDGFAPVAVEQTAGLRAAALVSQMPPSWASRAAIGRLSAAWVHGCSPPPGRITLLIDRGHRTTALPAGSGCTLHEVSLGGDAVVRLGGANVTASLRTAVDVALHEDPATALSVLRAFITRPGTSVTPARLRTALGSLRHVRGKRAALLLLGGLVEPAEES